MSTVEEHSNLLKLWYVDNFLLLMIISPKVRFLGFSMISELRQFDGSFLVYHDIYCLWFVFYSLEPILKIVEYLVGSTVYKLGDILRKQINPCQISIDKDVASTIIDTEQ